MVRIEARSPSRDKDAPRDCYRSAPDINAAMRDYSAATMNG